MSQTKGGSKISMNQSKNEPQTRLNEENLHKANQLKLSLKKQFTGATQIFSQWLSLSSLASHVISKTKDAVSDIIELDSTLTEIGKTSSMTEKELQQLSTESYRTASKYGKNANDYLANVHSMSQSGFHGETGKGMAEQSMLAQAAGNMAQDIAEQYIIATDAAYKFNGESGKINDVLDGQTSISVRNRIALQEIAVAMSEAGAVASGYQVSVKELSAMIGTIESATKLNGSETGDSIKSLLNNLQNISSEKITNTLEKANASMTEIVNGTERLRNPIAILRDLAETFNQLDGNAPLKSEILTNIGGTDQAAQLSALLQNMNLFDKMLVDYSKGKGAALEETNKSANSLSGTFNKLSNSWTELINNIITSDGLKTGADLLSSMIQGASKLVSILTPLGTIGAGAGLFAGIKNTGKCRMSVRIS